MTLLGSLPLETSSTIRTTSLKSGNDIVDNFEWISVPFTATSKEVLRPTVPMTCASGTAACKKIEAVVKKWFLDLAYDGFYGFAGEVGQRPEILIS